MFNAIALGTGAVSNYSTGGDCASTLGVLRSLGVEMAVESGSPGAGPSVIIRGAGSDGLSEPAEILDAGNSGTTMRLMSGILAGREMLAVVSGDESLRSRPMGRITVPLGEMGAHIYGRGGGSLAPLVFAGGSLRGMEHRLPVASAQLKSALLLAGLRADGDTSVVQAARTRDHTERMLRAMGGRICEEGLKLTIGPSELEAADVAVPGDISAAAFWIVAAIAHPDAELVIRDVGVNPTRAGVLDALRRMGADILIENAREVAGEPMADIVARSSELRGGEVSGDIVPILMDEIPVIAVAAAMATGETRIRDAAELKVKESDRIAATVEWLRVAGVDCEPHEDGMTIRGAGRLGGGRHHSHGDHRIAMSLGIAGLVGEGTTTIEDGEVASISYPSFWDEVERLGGLIG